ncbi:TPA: hypothetical protein ACKR1W_000344 [Proteus mirabilis]|uniref:hypothetical protein n=1 Tax=Proteus mirabilis TaxID=584 RepID=UPI0034D3B783
MNHIQNCPDRVKNNSIGMIFFKKGLSMDKECMYRETIENIKYQAHKIIYLANSFDASLVDAINFF